MDRVANYRDDLIDEVADVAADDAETAVDVASRLAAEREAILTSMRRTLAVMGAVKVAGVPVPYLLLVLMAVFVVLGEVADELICERTDDPED